MTGEVDPRDPLAALRAPVRPVAPDPEFAAALRARLERAVLNPTEVAVTSTEPTSVSIPTIGPTEGDVLYSSLWTHDLDRARTFYASVLGWRLTPDAQPQVADVRPPMGLRGGAEHNTLFLCHAVDDLAEAVARIRLAGGQAEEPVRRPYGLIADCVDNQGMRFAVLEAPVTDRGPVADPGVGELLYLTVSVPDTASYRRFYDAVFGWTFTPGRVNDGWAVVQPRPMTGMHRADGPPTVVPMFGVPDVAAAVALVRAGGGTADDPVQRPYGLTADCVDNQGMPFYLGQL